MYAKYFLENKCDGNIFWNVTICDICIIMANKCITYHSFYAVWTPTKGLFAIVSNLGSGRSWVQIQAPNIKLLSTPMIVMTLHISNKRNMYQIISK